MINIYFLFNTASVRCCPMVVSAYSVIVHWINPSWWTH